MKKKNLYLRALLIYCLVLALLIGAGLVVLYRFLVSYEASRPDNTVESYMAANDRDHWLEGLQSLIGSGLCEFSLTTASPTDYGIDEGGEISWRSAGGDETVRYYDIRLGGAKICTLSLSPNEDVGFGLKSWSVSGEQFRIPGSSDITISVPSGCTAAINGVEISEGYAVGAGTLGVEPAHSFDRAPASDIYVVKDMVGPAEVKAFSPDGTELEARSVSPTEIEFYPIPTESFCFYTLPGAQVSVNGQDITGSCCSDLGDDLGAEILRYECSGLYAAPEISVSINGESVQPVHMGIGTCFIPGAGGEIDGELAEFIEGFIYAYVDFSANKDRAASANFSVLSAYLLPGSELYTLTADSVENIAWASTSGLVYNGIDYGDLIPLGGGRYICSIYYDISYTLGSNDLDISSGNSILIEEHEGRLCVAAMSAELKG